MEPPGWMGRGGVTLAEPEAQPGTDGAHRWAPRRTRFGFGRALMGGAEAVAPDTRTERLQTQPPVPPLGQKSRLASSPPGTPRPC